MQEQPNSLLIRGRWLFPGGAMPEQVIDDGALLIQDGTIVEVGDWDDLRGRHPNLQVIGSGQHAVLPGFINAHHHSSGASHIQHGRPDLLLEPWLLALAQKRREDRFLATQLAAARLLRSGVTSVVDIHSGHGDPDAFAESIRRPLQAYAQAGIRVAFGVGMTERSHLVAGDDEAFLASLPAEVQRLARKRLPEPGAATVDDYFDIFDNFWQSYAGHPRIQLWLAPPGPQWVSEAFLARIAEAAERYDTNIQTHVAESIYEKQYSLRVHGISAIGYLNELGLLSPRFSIAHGVWLTEAEIELLAETGAAISHNPSSNLRLRAGIAPLNGLLAAGVTVGLGLDGTTLNDNDDMWQEMRLALRLHRTPRLKTPAPSSTDIFRLATHGGASLMRAADRRGALATGYPADLVLLDLKRVTWPWVAPEVDPLALILYRAAAQDVDTVLIDGKVVVENGRVTTIDEEAVRQELVALLEAMEFSTEQASLVTTLSPYIEQYYEGWEIEPAAPYISYNSRT
jgi:cytosine/adenosine deaminase-related metal-dependent hydrolase